MSSSSTKPAIKFPTCQLWINGRSQPSLSGKTFSTYNPATEDELAQISQAGKDDVDLAVKAARAAFESGLWPRMKTSDRIKILRKLATLIEENGESLALLETLDSGKPISETKNGDIPGAARSFEYYSSWADKLSGETLALDPTYFSFTLREPLGVIAAITPWNFPLSIAAQKIAPALAVGNTVVLKPAEQTPLTALRLAELSADAGMPPGVLNVITGFGEEAGAALVEHPEVDGISFTGEYKTGQMIMKNASTGLKRLSFELGGKSANIIFADADLPRAAEFACDGIFYNQGEVCCAGSRLFIEDKIKEDFTQALLEEARSWKPKDPLDPESEMGAIVSEEQFNKILSYIDIGQKEGADLIMDGRRKKEKGFFIGPTIFDNVSNNMRLAQEEIFGPVLAQIPFTDFKTVIAEANHSFYGLAAAVWTQNIDKAISAAKALKAGTIWVNGYGAFHHAMPFGGYKMSGTTREGGIHTFDFYTQMKSVWIHLNHS